MHVCDQASYIAYLYREKGGAAKPWQRGLDVSVILFSLYSYAMYRHVNGTFKIGDTTLWFPDVPQARLVRGYLRRRDRGPHRSLGRLHAESASAARGRRHRTSSSWRSRSASRSSSRGCPSSRSPSRASTPGTRSSTSGSRTSSSSRTTRSRRTSLAKKLAQPGKFFRYYGWNILLTTGATVIIVLLTIVLKLPAEPSYYAVVLSFLLVHYAHDHVLFAFGSGFRPK